LVGWPVRPGGVPGNALGNAPGRSDERPVGSGRGRLAADPAGPLTGPPVRPAPAALPPSCAVPAVAATPTGAAAPSRTAWSVSTWPAGPAGVGAAPVRAAGALPGWGTSWATASPDAAPVSPAAADALPCWTSVPTRRASLPCVRYPTAAGPSSSGPAVA